MVSGAFRLSLLRIVGLEGNIEGEKPCFYGIFYRKNSNSNKIVNKG